MRYLFLLIFFFNEKVWSQTPIRGYDIDQSDNGDVFLWMWFIVSVYLFIGGLIRKDGMETIHWLMGVVAFALGYALLD